MEEYEESAAGVHVAAQTSSLKYGLWINTTKNPRLKSVEFPQLGISIEVTDCTLWGLWLSCGIAVWRFSDCWYAATAVASESKSTQAMSRKALDGERGCMYTVKL